MQSKDILIISSSLDSDAQLIRWSLRQAGFNVTVLDTARGIDQQGLSFEINPSRDESANPIDDFDAVWCRRRFRPVGHYISTHPENVKFAKSERSRFQTGWLHFYARTSQTFWVGKPASIDIAENKLLQLSLAKECGLSVPHTLISSDPTKIRRFIRNFSEIVVKPIDPFAWEYRASGIAFQSYANAVKSEVLSEMCDPDLSVAPTIYQQRLAKEFDLRVVVMGENVYAFSFHQIKTNDIDYRAVMNGPQNVQVRHYSLSAEVVGSLRLLLDRLDLNFCSADLVFSDGKFYFLDLNPMGQFLFIDDYLDTANLCSKFCNFITTGDSEFGQQFAGNNLYANSPEFADWQNSHQSDIPAIEEVVDNEICS